MRVLTRTALLISTLGVPAIMAAPAHAAGVNQRTGDGIVPSIETVCDGDPYSFGLCNAYCEALDCEDPTPLGTPTACANLLRNYQKKSGGASPPCACPCGFNLQADVAALVAAGEEEIDIDILESTYRVTCGNAGPAGEPALVFVGFDDPPNPNDTPQGVQLFYWLDATAVTCNEEGGGLDDPSDLNFPGFWDYGPFIQTSSSIAGSGVAGACSSLLLFLCEKYATE